MWFIGRDECTPPKKNPGSAPGISVSAEVVFFYFTE